MIVFFFVNSLGFFLWFLSTELVFNNYYQVSPIILIVGLIPQMVLLFFFLTVYELSLSIRLISISVATLLCILDLFIPFFNIYLIDPNLSLYPLISSAIFIANIVLFILNWKTNNDPKSLYFSIGLILNMMAMITGQFSELLQGLFLIFTAIIWIITYSGLIEKLYSYKNSEK